MQFRSHAVLAALVMSLVSIAALAPAAGAAPTFSGPVTAGSTAPGAYAVAIGDLDGDGDKDLAVANSYSSTVTVLTKGAGGYTASTAGATGAYAVSIAIGDLDGDGDMDLATANADANTVTVLTKGPGGYTSSTAGSTGTSPHSVAIADLDGDGDKDLATANFGSSTVTVLTKDAGGYTASTVSTGGGPDAVAIGDLDGDGDMDLATANQSANNVTVLTNDAGVYTASTAGSTGTTPYSVAIGDLDGDGDQDLATANLSSDNVTVLTKGVGGYTASTAGSTGHNPVTVAIGDLDGDGDQDLATANGSANNVTVLTKGAGGYTASTAGSTGSIPQSLAIGDLDGDGDKDLAVVNNGAGNVSVLTNTTPRAVPNAFVQPAGSPFAAGTAPDAVAVGDFNRDGRQDLAIADQSSEVNNVSLLIGSGSGTFTPGSPVTVGSLPVSVVVGDFNGDGIEDLATADADSNAVSVLIGSGSGTFTPGSPVTVGSSPNSVVVGDFNGDGKQDLATANYNSNTVSVLIGSGSGAFTPGSPVSVGSRPASVVVGDFNGDGKQDLATASYDASTVSVLIGSGSGTFTPDSPVSVVSSAISMVVGDFNGDGKQDLATANYDASTVSVLIGSGSGTFAVRSPATASPTPYGTAVGDFNGDGQQDLAATSFGSSRVSVHLGVVADLAAPTTTDNVPAAVQTTRVTVTLTATDTGGSGVNKTYYTTGVSPVDPTTASSVYNPASKPTLGDGEKIKYFSVDLAGNAESVKTSIAARVNLPPVVGGVGSVSYTENAAPTAVAPALTISDTAGTTITSATVSLQFAQPGDELSYTTTNGVVGTVNPAKTAVTFTTPQTMADYEAALRAIKFDSTTDVSAPSRLVTFRVSDGTSLSNTATATINVIAVNDLPTVTTTVAPLAYDEQAAAIAVDDAVTATDPDDANFASGQVLLTNPQAGDELSYTTTAGVAGTVNGAKDTVTFSAAATTANYQLALRAVRFRNTSDAPSTTPRSVRFKVNDGDGDSNVATRTIDVTPVNDAPVGVADAFTVSEDVAFTAPAPGVLGNDTDVDDDSLSVGEVAGAAGNVGVQQTTAKGAKVTINADGSLAYDANGQFEGLDAGETDTDSVTYTPSDGTTTGATTTVTFTVQGVNDAPVAVDDARSVDEDQALTVAAPGMLGNDTDPDVEPLTVDRVAGSAANVSVETTTGKGAKVTLRADGSLSYDPNGQFEALNVGETDTDTVTYRVTDGDASSNTATVTITIDGVDSAAPVTTDDVPATYRNAPIEVTLTATDAGGSGGLVTKYRIVSAGGTAGAEQTYDPTSKPTLLDGEKIRYFTTDAEGNVEATKESAAAKVDGALPQTDVTSQPAASTSDRRPELVFGSASAGASFECSLDDSAFAPCTSPFRPASDLADGEHTLRVRAISRSGDPDPTPAVITFTVDTVKPAAPSDMAGPPEESSSTTQTFVFGGEAAASFVCALDDGPMAPCSSPFTVTELTVGGHRFTVAQVDEAGNVGPTRITAFTTTANDGGVPADSAKTARTVVSPGRQVFAFGGKITVGCATDQGPLKACVARIVSTKGVVLASGRTNAGDPRATSLAVTLSRTRAGRLALRKKPDGFPAFVEITVITPGGRTLTQRTKILFSATQKVTVSTGIGATLGKVQRAQIIALTATLKTAKSVNCTGHTAVQQGVSAAREKALSLRQAKAACALIKRLAPRVKTPVNARGETRPRATNKTKAGRNANQRIVLTLA
jgi:VCBS repeat-containing protein